jgi:hypothetical protein
MWSTLLNTDPYASVQIAGIYASHQTNGSHLVTISPHNYHYLNRIFDSSNDTGPNKACPAPQASLNGYRHHQEETEKQLKPMS